MGVEHYHLMTELELGYPPRLGGVIYAHLTDAAREMWRRCKTDTPALIFRRAREVRERDNILRARQGDGYVYLAICEMTTCDLSHMRYHGATFTDGALPPIHLERRANGETPNP